MRRTHIAILSCVSLLFVCTELSAVYLRIELVWELVALGLISCGIGALGSRLGLRFHAVLFALLPAWLLYGGAYFMGWLGNHGQVFAIYPLTLSTAAVVGAVALGGAQVHRAERSFGYALAVCLVSGVTLLSFTLATSRGVAGVQPYSFDLYNGQQISSKQLLGHPVVIAFWADWCIPCRRELPHLETLYRRYKSKAAFFLVDVNGREEMSTKAIRFLKKRKIGLPAVESGAGHLERLFDPDKVVPVIVVLGRKGKVVYEHYGFTGSMTDLGGLEVKLRGMSP